MSELLPCPFCGEDKRLEVQGKYGRGSVRCHSCGSAGPYYEDINQHEQYALAQAAHLWNQRGAPVK